MIEPNNDLGLDKHVHVQKRLTFYMKNYSSNKLLCNYKLMKKWSNHLIKQTFKNDLVNHCI